MIGRLLSLVLAALAVPAAGQSHVSTPTTGFTSPWKELGPAPIANGSYAGRVSAIVCSPSDPNLYYLGGADGGVWRTEDGGDSWTPLTGHLPTTSIGALALDPSDENTVYAGTGEANFANHCRYGLGLYKSVDGGDTWEHLAESTFAGRCFSRLVVRPGDGQTVYAAISRAGGFPELAGAKGHPEATGDVGVFRSLDGGTTWTRLTGGLPNLSATDLEMDPSNSDVLYCAIGRIFGSAQNGIYKTVDGGATWTKLAGGLPASTQVGRTSLAVAPSDSTRLYALIAKPAVSTGANASTEGAYVSSDAGATWGATSLGNIQATYGWYLSVVAVDPTDPDLVYMGGLSLERSRNKGGSFSTITPPHVDQHALAFDAMGRMLSGNDGGVHRSTDEGNSWVSRNDGLGTIQFYAGLSCHPTDDHVLLGGVQDNGSNQRTSDSSAWTQVYGGDGGWTQIDPTDPDRRFVEYQGTRNLYRSTNGGSTFTWAGSGITRADRNCFLPPYLIDPTDSNRMLFGTHRLYRSMDGSATWSAISADLSNGTGAIRTLAMSPADPDVVWAATNDGNIQVSQDGGFTFTLVLSGIPGWPRTTREIFCHPTDAATAWLAVSAFGTAQIRRTVDLGATWADLDATLPDVPVNTVAVLPGNVDQIFAGTDAGLLFSPDGGATWGEYGEGLPHVPIIDILLEPDRGRLIIATQGRGAWLAKLFLRR